MLDRFFVPGDWPSDVVSIDETEAHHLLHVLRKRKGDRVEIFNGRGHSAEAEVMALGRIAVEVRIVSQLYVHEASHEHGVSIAVAPPKGERLKSMVEKLTEIGVARILLLSTERSIVEPREAKLDKLEQAAVAACKQCRRNSLPEIVQPMSIKDALTACRPDTTFWVADQPSEPADRAVSTKNASCCFIGPEGGFTDAELEQLTRAGARRVNLAPHVLRVETAAIVAAGWLVGANQPE